MSTLFESGAARFGEAARMAALLELWVRHLADFTPALRSVALAHKLETVEDGVLLHFSAVLGPGEAEAVRAARGIRNKLLHCEFWTALSRVQSTGRVPRVPPVSMMNLATGEIKDATEVSESEPRIYGWVAVGSANDGFFAHAEHVFTDAIVVVKRLFLPVAASDGAAQP